MQCSEKTSPQLAVYTFARSGKFQPILIKLGSEAKLFVWHGDLEASTNSIHGRWHHGQVGASECVQRDGEGGGDGLGQ